MVEISLDVVATGLIDCRSTVLQVEMTTINHLNQRRPGWLIQIDIHESQDLMLKFTQILSQCRLDRVWLGYILVSTEFHCLSVISNHPACSNDVIQNGRVYPVTLIISLMSIHLSFRDTYLSDQLNTDAWTSRVADSHSGSHITTAIDLAFSQAG